ncbi:ribonuclease H-like domain-containing protein [Tanacetum coccineum]
MSAQPQTAQATTLPQAFQTITSQDPSWNMDTGASSHLADNIDYQTQKILLRCDSMRDLYPVTQQPSLQTQVVLLSLSSTTWHSRLGHPGDDVLHRLVFSALLVCYMSQFSAYSKTDSSLFVFHRGSEIAYLLLYVDDIILTASSSAFLQRIIASLYSEFAMTDLGSLNYFLGISAQRSASGLFLSQSKFAKEILERAHMQNYP